MAAAIIIMIKHCMSVCVGEPGKGGCVVLMKQEVGMVRGGSPGSGYLLPLLPGVALLSHRWILMGKVAAQVSTFCLLLIQTI